VREGAEITCRREASLKSVILLSVAKKGPTAKSFQKSLPREYVYGTKAIKDLS
jgi:hypothetical protein